MNEPIHSLTLMLVRGLAFLIIGLIVYAFLRKRSATAQNDFWRFVHVALVTVPLLGLLPSVWNLSLGPDLPPPITDTDSTLVESAQSTELPPLIVNEPEEAEIRTAGHFGFGWEINLALLWAIGATSILMRFAVGYLKLHKLRRG